MTILAIGAHPDDIEFGAGAILLNESMNGSKIHMLILSKGEAATNGTPEERENESREAAKLLNAEIEFMDFGGDSTISSTPASAHRIAEVIRKTRPDIILAPQVEENQHPDHSAVGKMTRDACRYARYGGLSSLVSTPTHKVKSLLFYPSTPNINSKPDILVDVTKIVEDWKKIMNLHETQMKTKKYSDMLLTLSHLWGMQINTDYAWGLYKNDPIVLDSLSEISTSTPNF